MESLRNAPGVTGAQATIASAPVVATAPAAEQMDIALRLFLFNIRIQAQWDELRESDRLEKRRIKQERTDLAHKKAHGEKRIGTVQLTFALLSGLVGSAGGGALIYDREKFAGLGQICQTVSQTFTQGTEGWVSPLRSENTLLDFHSQALLDSNERLSNSMREANEQRAAASQNNKELRDSDLALIRRIFA